VKSSSATSSSFRLLRFFLGTRLPQLFVLAILHPAHILGPLLAFSISHKPPYNSAMLPFTDSALAPPPKGYGWNPYSRADWTELKMQFHPPRDGASVSIRLRDYASPEEIDVVIAALQLRRRELGARARVANGISE